MNEIDKEAPGIFAKKRFKETCELRIAFNEADLAKLSSAIGRGADINKVPGGGYNILHLSVDRNRLRFAELLIMAGADLNVPNCFGRTALMIAADKGYTEMLKLLLRNTRNKADVLLKNPFDMLLRNNPNDNHGINLSAKDYASKNNNFECLQILMDAEKEIEFEIAEEELKKSSKDSAPELK